MKLVSESAEINSRPAETVEECVMNNHLSYIPSFRELFDGASEWAKDQGCNEETAESFAFFYAEHHDGQALGACMPKRRALKIEYTRHLEMVENLHPSRQSIEASL